MSRCRLLSYQLLRWSVTYEKTLYRLVEAAAHGSGPAVALGAGDPARIVARTLQTMWQTRLLLRPRAWAWAQVLSFRKPLRREPSGRVCPSGLPRTGRDVSG